MQTSECDTINGRAILKQMQWFADRMYHKKTRITNADFRDELKKAVQRPYSLSSLSSGPSNKKLVRLFSQ